MVGETSTAGQPSTSHKEKGLEEGGRCIFSYCSLDIDCKGWEIKIKISS